MLALRSLVAKRIQHAEFPQGISVNVVSHESTPFLIGLDVLREFWVGHRLPLPSRLQSRLVTSPSLCNSSDKTSCFGNDAEQQ